MVFIVADHDLKTAEQSGHTRVQIDVPKVSAETDTREDANRPGKSFRIVAGVLERFPCTFKKETVLRVNDFSFARDVIKERSVKHLDVFQHRRGIDVIRTLPQGRVEFGSLDLFVSEKRNRFDTVAQILPEL